MRISKATQDKLEQQLKAHGYIVRYEKGLFKGGYCLVRDKKTVILNKFHPLESHINALNEIIRELGLPETA
jgi:hypothetical protein